MKVLVQIPINSHCINIPMIFPLPAPKVSPRRRFGHRNDPGGAHIQAMHDARTQLRRVG